MIIPLEMFQMFFCFLAVTHSVKHTDSPLSSSQPLAEAHLQLQWSTTDATFFLHTLLARQWRKFTVKISSWRARYHCNGSFTKWMSILLLTYKSTVARWKSVEKFVMQFFSVDGYCGYQGGSADIHVCVYICIKYIYILINIYVFVYIYMHAYT